LCRLQFQLEVKLLTALLQQLLSQVLAKYLAANEREPKMAQVKANLKKPSRGFHLPLSENSWL